MASKKFKIGAVCAVATMILSACGGGSDSTTTSASATSAGSTATTDAAGSATTSDQGSGTDTSSSDTGTEPTSQGSDAPAAADAQYDIKALVVPAMPAAAIYLADEQGFLGEEGITLDAQPAQTGAAGVAALLNGEAQIAYISTVVAIRAAAEGVPIVWAAAGDVVPGPGDPNQDMYGGLVVPPDSSLSGYADLAGKTIAVNQLEGVDMLAIMKAVDDAGGDSSTLEFVEVAYPEMGSAISSGRVAAASLTDPFHAAAIAAGEVKELGDVDTLTALGAGSMVAGFITSADFATSDPDAVAAFQRGMAKAADYGNENPDAVRAVIPSFTELTPEQVETVGLPTFTNKLDVKMVQQVADLMVQYGYLESDFDASTMIK